MSSGSPTSPHRMSAERRREDLIVAAIDEFASSGLHGTPVQRIAYRAGVAQPYVFSLFATKRDLFVAAVERVFERLGDLFTEAAIEFERAHAGVTYAHTDILHAIGCRYLKLVASNRPLLMLQLQAYAACDDQMIRERVSAAYERLSLRIRQLSAADDDELRGFVSQGMWPIIQTAMTRP